MAPLALHQRSLGSIKEAAAHSRGCRSQATSAPAAPAAEPKKLWGGRFTGKTDPLMEKFNESLPFDKRLWAEDIRHRAAHWAGTCHSAWDRSTGERCCPSASHASFTHLQNAMTVRWSHWLMCHCSAWQRDDMRLRDLAPRVAMLPLGSGLSADMLATDLAEYLVRKGVPFRETHHHSGAAVKMAEDRGCTLFDLTVADLKTIHPLFTEDVAAVWDFNRSAEMRDTEGGTSKRSVLEQVVKMKSYVAAEQAAM
ncbi:Argininosuccinate lyase [Tetrabaena socialis]|uniref:Argininosuccinate lyase n=1 Tax=Tetrabaena socialis TaxID=47790 RepID=A0A2J7ZXN0_9CHLO|nr:Argininosuccinate lyase [Tetrabaena socialis]|eukprot:PNH05027.1 Argininosuccinate lyase [Tetrabaena socialis]